MKWKNLFLLMLCMVFGLVFTSCDENNDGDNGGGGNVIENIEPSDRVFILNEGNYNSNNSGIDMYSRTGGADGASLFIQNAYMNQNGEGLGDVGQDLISHDGNLYASITGSSLLVKMDNAAKKLATISFDASEGQPRYLAAKNGKIYVTLYGGYVAKIDAGSFQKEAMVQVGSNPEGIVESNGKLYVCNSGWGYDNTMSVIDIATFTVEKTVEVASNPNEIIAAGGKIFIQSYGGAYPDYDYQVQMYDPASGNVERLTAATKLAAYDDVVYIVYSDTDWATYTTTNVFSTYNVETGELKTENYLKDMPASLSSNGIYMMDIDPSNGDFYVSVSDYVSDGTVYRFNHDGVLIDTMLSGGMNPTKTVFIN